MTLIELMVATVLSLVLLSGVLTIFQGSRFTQNLQNGMATVQENGRHGLYLLVRDIRGAGFSGCAGIAPTVINLIANSPPDGITDFTEGEVIFGINDIAATNPYSAVEGTDVIRVRGAGDASLSLVGNTVPVNANIQTTVETDMFEAGDILILTDCESTDIFRATAVSSGSGTTTISHSNSQNSSNFLSKPYDRDAFMMSFKSNTYFVRDTGRVNTAGDAIRALFREDYDGNVTELVDGIDDMQITYGVDVTGDDVVDRFINAPAAGSSLWAQVIMVRLALLVNSVENASTEPVNYTYFGATTTPVDPTDLRLRQEMGSTITLRNRVD